MASLFFTSSSSGLLANSTRELPLNEMHCLSWLMWTPACISASVQEGSAHMASRMTRPADPSGRSALSGL
eukprot:6041375-Pleurochrysis_carterae.AAC.1